MTDPRARPDDRPNVGSEPLEEEIQALQGEELPIDQDAVLDPEEIEGPREATLTEQEWGTAPTPDRELLAEADEDRFVSDVEDLLAGDTRIGMAPARPDTTSLDELTDSELREGETTDALVATEEGQTWVPPSDPPIVPSPDDPDGVEVPGAAEQDEAESGLNAEVREALRSDGSTSALADRLEIAIVGSTAIIRGQVDGIEDTDAILAVVGDVPGIEDVRDETEVAGL